MDPRAPHARSLCPLAWLALASALTACAPTRARGYGTLTSVGGGAFVPARPVRAASPGRTPAYGRPRLVLDATIARVTADAIDLDIALSSEDGVHASSTSWFIDLVDDAQHRESEPEILRESRAHDEPIPFQQRCPSTDHQLQRMPGGEMLEPPPTHAGGLCTYNEHYFTRASRLRFHRGELLRPGARSLSLVLTDATVRVAIRWSIAPGVR